MAQRLVRRGIVVALLCGAAGAQETLLWEHVPPVSPFVGRALLAVPDQDGDGWDELWVAASIGSSAVAGCERTRISLLSGRTGQELAAQELTPVGLASWTSMASVPDQTGDGVEELLIGVNCKLGPLAPGTLVLADGATGAELAAQSGGFQQSRWAESFVLVDDSTGDGYPEVAVADAGEPSPFGPLIGPGVVRIWDPVAWQELPGTELLNVFPGAFANCYGRALAVVSDVTGDGVSDLVVGDPCASGGAGRLQVIDPVTKALHTEWFAGVGESLGSQLFAWPDLTGDGVPEVAATALIGVPVDGAAHIRRFDPTPPAQPTLVDTLVPIDAVSKRLGGQGLVPLPDVTGDGIEEVLSWTTSLNCASAPMATVEAQLHFLDGATGDLLYRRIPDCGQIEGWAAASLGSPLAPDPRPVYVVSLANVFTESSIRAYAFDVPRTAGNPGACAGLDVGWSGWVPNWQGFPTEIELDGAEPLQVALLFFGVDTTSWAGLPLPFDLGLLGGPGCAVLVAPVQAFGVPIDASGHAAFPITLSGPGPSGVGLDLFAQWIALGTANPLGFGTSDLLQLELLP